MSEIKVNSVSNYKKTAPIEFPTGISGDGSALSTPPEIISFTPQPLSVGISTDTNITIVFDQTIQFSGVGTIFIREGSDTGSITTSFTCGISTRATISGIGSTTLTIDPEQPLGFGISYYVTLPTIGITNTFGQYYAGIETNRYFFTTQYPALFSATGGTYTYTVPAAPSPTGFYRYHIFSSSGILTTSSPNLNATDFQFQMVAGGGGGGTNSSPYSRGGGGGAGGLITRTGPTLVLSAGTYIVTVGGGGGFNPTQPGTPPYIPPQGTNTRLSSSPTVDILSAAGGGGGAAGPGQSGGSGGGSWPPPGNPYPGGAGVPGQGNPGGGGSRPGPTIGNSGGGGGAGAAGSPLGPGGNGSPNPAFASPFLSGYIPTPVLPAEALSTIGPTGLYAGGGGGVGPTVPAGGVGGSGGGGGGPYSLPVAQGIAKSLTGGGGAGAPDGSALKRGASGSVMIRYAVPGS